jgi:drug/metabolite transporter (DMT)-like permease
MVWLIVVSCVWAFSFVIIKGTLTGLDSNLVSLVRMLFSLIIFLPFLRIKGIKISEAIWLAVIGSIQFGLMYVSYIAAYAYLPAHMIVLLTTTTPLFVILFNDGLEKRFNGMFFIAALCAVAAGVIVKYPAQEISVTITGVVLVQLSNLAFAAGQVMYKRFASRRPVLKDSSVFGLLYLGAVMVTAGFSACTVHLDEIRLSVTQLWALGYLGLIASGLCFFFWNHGAKSVNAGTLAVMNNLKIPLGIIVSIVFLSEKTDYPRLGAGFVLMAAALIICESIGKRRLLTGASRSS